MVSRAGGVIAEQRIGGRYVLRSPLGEGGMGSVWRATDTARDVDVAVKLVGPEAVRGRDLRAMFQQEADLSERMLSRNIVRVLDRGLEPQPFIVLELLTGTTLSQRLGQGPLAVSDTVTLVTQVCRALVRAHGVGVIHRDIKPDNLFLCHEDERMLVKVLDFGVAALRSEAAPDAGGMSGTIGYMSPEHLLEGTAGDERSDLFAVGVVAYECLTGTAPFAHQSLADYLVALSTTRPAPPSTLRPGLPPGIDPWMARAIAFDRADRFVTASEMADALLAAYQPVAQASVAASRRERARTSAARDVPVRRTTGRPPPDVETPPRTSAVVSRSNRGTGAKASAASPRSEKAPASERSTPRAARPRASAPPATDDAAASGRYVVVVPRETRRKPR